MSSSTLSLNDDYVKAGYTGHLDFGRNPCLLHVDFARAYIDQSCSLYAGVEASVVAAAEVLKAARAANILVCHTRVEYSRDGTNGGVFFRKVPALRNFIGATQYGAFVEGLEPLPHEPVFVKQYASAFFGTSLASTLAAASIDTVLIAGWSTSGCIRASTLDACQYGFVPIVIRQAVGDRHPEPYRASLFDLQAKYAEVKSKDEVVAYLNDLKRIK